LSFSLAPGTPITVSVSDSALTAVIVDECDVVGVSIVALDEVRTLSSTVVVALQLSLTYFQLSVTFLLLFHQFSF